jgi:HEAT repeat protein
MTPLLVVPDVRLRLLQGRRRTQRAALFEAFRHASFDMTRAWALAGLARAAPDSEVVKELLDMMADERSFMRVAAADGLFALEDPPQEAIPIWKQALSDTDLRVRWRAAAALLAAGESDASVLPELARGIDGPDDVERIAALEAVTKIGAIASPLADRLEAWAASPFNVLAKPARKALASVR